jgi:hypothetical protein
LAPVDLSALQDKLGKVKGEIEANDPKALKAKIADLLKQLAAKPSNQVAKSNAADETRLRSEGYNAGWAAAMKDGAKDRARVNKELSAIGIALHKAKSLIPDTLPLFQGSEQAAPQVPIQRALIAAPRPRAAVPAQPADGVTRPQQRVLDALAWWSAAGHEQPSREQVAGVAGYSPTSGGFNNLLGGTNAAGWTLVPAPGLIALTDAGAAIAHCDAPPSTEDLHARVQGILSNPQWKLMAALLEAHPEAMTRDALGEASGYSPSSGGFNNLIGSLSTLRMIEKPQPGSVRAADWLFLEQR